MEENTQILIVSDNTETQALYQKYIDKVCTQSAELVIKTNLKEAQEFLTGMSKVKCILLDHTMSNQITSKVVKNFIKENKGAASIILLVTKDYEQNFSAGMQLGAVDYLVTPGSSIGEFHSVLAKAMGNKSQAGNMDSLTGLPNKMLFESMLLKTLSKAHRDRSRVATFFINLSGFANINRLLGADKGDLILKQIVKRFQSMLRVEDMVARIDGDKFAIVSESMRDMDDVNTISEKLKTEFSKPFFLEDYEINVNIDVATSVYPAHGKTLADVVKSGYQKLHDLKANSLLTFACDAKKSNSVPETSRNVAL